jgi:hypothetical protein
MHAIAGCTLTVQQQRLIWKTPLFVPDVQSEIFLCFILAEVIHIASWLKLTINLHL